MTKEEAIDIKGEILKKEGSVYVYGIFKADGVVLIKDMLDIINKHIEEKR